MALTINTNLSSMIVQKNLNSATTGLNSAIEKMTTGYRINHAKDDAAGYSIATSWATKCFNGIRFAKNSRRKLFTYY